MSRALGRRKPKDRRHVELYPFSAVAPESVESVETVLTLPDWHWTHDQGHEGSCVGHGSAMERAISNIAQHHKDFRYNPLWIWDQAKLRDEWPDTNPGDSNGTSVRAAYDVLRQLGLTKVEDMALDAEGDPYAVGEGPVKHRQGVRKNRWAATTDEMRQAISGGNPVTIGVNWYSNFDNPQEKIAGEWWVGEGSLGSIRGGHCVCVYGASDEREAFIFKNSWGREYPLVWIPYTTMQKLLDDDGEATLQTDR